VSVQEIVPRQEVEGVGTSAHHDTARSSTATGNGLQEIQVMQHMQGTGQEQKSSRSAASRHPSLLRYAHSRLVSSRNPRSGDEHYVWTCLTYC
jgi:hypothetical protein